MKKTINILSALTIAAVLTTGFTACNSEDIAVQQPTGQSAAAKTFTMSIPATMPTDDTRAMAFSGTTSTRTFQMAEKIYVYNATKGAMFAGYLQPANISADGRGCDLTGTLDGTIEAGDELQLFYNMNSICELPADHVYYDIEENLFCYTDQDGTPSSLVDGAIATAEVDDFSSNVLTTTATASFQPVQSMFRFQFKDENNNPINVRSLEIKSKNDALVDYYMPLASSHDSQNQHDKYSVTLATPTTDFIYLAIRVDENISNGDELSFTAVDADGNGYVGTRNAPAGGFKNGKYYYNTSAIQLTKVVRVAPTITWTSVENGTAVTPDQDCCYWVHAPNDTDPIEISISGTSIGYTFYFAKNATIHLDNLTATVDKQTSYFYGNRDITLDINGANSVSCVNHFVSICAVENLKLTGNGTLTVTVKDNEYYKCCGICGFHNYTDSDSSEARYNYQTTITELDVTPQLALNPAKTTVTRSARTDNGDGTFTWTYTVVTNP